MSKSARQIALSPSRIDGNLIADYASFMQIYCRDRYL